jgi:hypothetical protein
MINIIANKILKSNNTNLTGLYTAQRAAGATAPHPRPKI